MKHKIPAMLFCPVFSLLLAAFSHPAILNAEIIQLKNGNAIETKILKENEEFVVVEAPGGKVKIPKSDIQTIWRGPKEQLVEVRGKEVYFAKGVELYKEGKFKESAASFERSLGPNAMGAIIYANLGSAYASAGMDPKAEEKAQRAREKAERKARFAQIKQLVEQNQVARVESDDFYNFVDGGKIKRVPVNPELRQRLISGELAIVRNEGRYAFVPAATAADIRARVERAVIHHNVASAAPDSDDPYKDFVVPDDLVW